MPPHGTLASSRVASSRGRISIMEPSHNISPCVTLSPDSERASTHASDRTQAKLPLRYRRRSAAEPESRLTSLQAFQSPSGELITLLGCRAVPLHRFRLVFLDASAVLITQSK